MNADYCLSTAPDAQVEKSPVTEPSAKTYTVVAGDSLYKIAKREYGDLLSRTLHARIDGAGGRRCQLEAL